MAGFRKEAKHIAEEELNNEIAKGTDADTKTMKDLKGKLNAFLEQESEGAKIRSRIQEYEEGEKSTRFFYAKIKQREKSKFISQLQDEEGNIYREQKDLLRLVHKYYTELYTSQNPEENNINNFLSDYPVILTGSHINYCDGFIKQHEVIQALRDMKNNKTPGLDGLPKEFYINTWEILGPTLTDVLNNCFLRGQLGDKMNMGNITLLFKKNDKSLLKNWRPISLLNVDYKIISKVLANRLRKILPDILHASQACGIPDRKIHHHLHLLDMIVTNYEQQYMNDGCYAICVDQEKAFDRVEHKYIFRLLEKMNFGPLFQKWIHILYKNAQSTITVNGFNTEPIKIQRSMRQGCPLSMLLFIIGLDPLIRTCQQNPSISGLRIPNQTEIKTLAYADDITFLTTDTKSIDSIFEVLDSYGQISGAKINVDKTEITILGNKALFLRLPEKWKVYHRNHVKILGINFGNDDAKQKQYDGLIDRMTDIIRSWESRRLTMYGKTLLINTVLLAQFWHTAKIYPPNPKQIQRIKTAIFQFLWVPRKIQPIKQETCYLSHEKGGLGVIDLDTRVLAIRLQNLVEWGRGPFLPWFSYMAYFLSIPFSRIFPNQISTYTRIKILNPPPKLHTLFKENKKLVMVLIKEEKLTIANIYGRLFQRWSIPAIVRHYPTIDWPPIFQKLLADKKLPHHLREGNFHIVHDILPTRIYYKNFLRHYYKTTPKCRLCNRKAETQQHLLYECEGLNPVRKTLIFLAGGSRFTNRQLVGFSLAPNEYKQFLLSCFWLVILKYLIKSNAVNDVEIIDLSFDLWQEVENYKHLYH